MKRDTWSIAASLTLGAAVEAGALAAAGAARAADDADGLIGAIEAGEPIVDFRLRWEGVEQTGLAEDASALTLRTHLGWETGAYRGFKALVEFEDVRAPVEDYNSTVNGKTAYPVVADPEVTELNRAQLAWTNGAGFTAIAGRQRIVLDNARFVGDVGWRQDQQTFDSALASYTTGGFTIAYAYIWGVERIFAEESDLDTSAHALNASYKVSDALKLTGFAYLLDIDQAAAQSTATYGVAAAGAVDFGEVKLTYAGTYATQSDYADNPGDVDLSYYRVDLCAAHGPLTLAGGYEVLEGDGTRGFSTPLATLHAFQGWGDVFLTTPASGIEDAFVTAKFAPTWSAGPVSAPALTLVWHDFSAEQGGADLGSEIDAQLTAHLAPRVSGVVKVADYDGPSSGTPGSLADRTKLWVGVQFTL